MIYLDYQATTPLALEVHDAMAHWLSPAGSANPHSAHVSGRGARAAVEVAREQVSALLPPGGKLWFTSGATEAANWALRGVGQGGIVTLPTEHACVRDTALWLGQRGHDVAFLPVDTDGLVTTTAIPDGTRIVAAMLVNNEIGVVQPIADLADAAHRAGALFFCDAVQGLGRVAIPAACDLIAISAHKIYGPKGIGALWVRDGLDLEPLMLGGGQEGGVRSGTVSPALCAGFGAAAALMATDDHTHVERLWTRALAQLPDWQVNGARDRRYHGNLNVRRDGLDAARLISDVRSVAFSAGSACASGSGRPSHVLTAIGLTDAQARSSIRLGFGRGTTAADIDEALSLITAATDRQRP
ncbi:cysteine desulfurase family protein [Sphingomonas sp.]|uniref:cysteine desulfurase family protein n=1 Tax=Sphingomonas sp. TaxID=28214 RepID=UPI0025ECD5E7|nr:cysteine desulfurase family protein [Sphingomonas sp.]